MSSVALAGAMRNLPGEAEVVVGGGVIGAPLRLFARDLCCAEATTRRNAFTAAESSRARAPS